MDAMDSVAVKREGIRKRAKIICPFTGRACTQCSLYRGRHYNWCFSGHSGDLQKCIGKKLPDGEKVESMRCAIPNNL